VKQIVYPLEIPFVRPDGLNNANGYYVSFPIAYSKSMRITLKWKGSSELEDEQLWNTSIICKRNDESCPVSAYYAVIANKLVHGSKLITTFGNYFRKESIDARSKLLDSVTKSFSKMTKSSEIYGPGMKSGCRLT
jgi:hypothetical protein